LDYIDFAEYEGALILCNLLILLHPRANFGD